MVWHIAVAIVKPFVVLWAVLNVIDDLSLLMRLGRLGVAILPRFGKGKQQEDDLCSVCDDVMGDLLKGSEGLSVVPCGLACLGVHKCVHMCERLKSVSASTTEFPCVAAGYCQATSVEVADPECRAGPLFTCLPRQYCRRRRKGLKMTCDLRPGIGRWVGLKNSGREHVVAFVEGLYSQSHCGEKGAGPYCIAKPVGMGAIAEIVGQLVALLYGGYKSILAIESPGGSDDRQWLTFWLIFALSLYIERFFARVILSTVPFYYEAKLALLLWLVIRSGAERVYRKLRGFLVGNKLLLADEKAAARTLDLMKASSKGFVEEQLARLGQDAKNNPRNGRPPSTSTSWDYDETEYSIDTDASRQLYLISKFLLSSEGAKALEDSTNITEEDASLFLERAAEVVSFQPRFLRVFLHGVVKDSPKGYVMSNKDGLADPYVTVQLKPLQGGEPPYQKHGVKSRILYKTVHPIWNQELELPLMGGFVDTDGYYRSNGVAKATVLLLSIRDADVGEWSIAYYFFGIAIVLAVIAAIVARIGGYADDLTGTQKLVELAVAILIVAGFGVSFTMAVVIRSGDKIIGNCEMPLDMLLDQRKHHFLLTFRKPSSGGGLKESKHSEATNGPSSVGCVAVLRVSLLLSEH